MKKVSSAVWKFFDRIEENKRCVAVLCKLCHTQYKYFGNTTNLRVHLINKHALQWELSQSGALDDANFQMPAESGDTSKTPKAAKRRSYKTTPANVRYSVSVKNDNDEALPHINIERIDVDDNSDSDDDETTINLVRQMHGDQNSEEEWLEEDPYQITHIETFEPQSKRKRKYRKIKREIPSPTGLPGFYVTPKGNKRLHDDTENKDEYSVFGEYIANKLRKLPSQRTRGNLQQLVTTILWQAEYGLYDNPETVKRVLLMNLQAVAETEEFEVQPINTQEVSSENVEVQNRRNSTDSTSVLIEQ